MNILVTGGAGYIGSHTAVELMNAGHHPIIVDDLSNARWDVRNRIGELCGRVPAFYQIDCADKKELRQVFKDYQIDAVIHFAGFKAPSLPAELLPLRHPSVPCWMSSRNSA